MGKPTVGMKGFEREATSRPKTFEESFPPPAESPRPMMISADAKYLVDYLQSEAYWKRLDRTIRVGVAWGIIGFFFILMILCGAFFAIMLWSGVIASWRR